MNNYTVIRKNTRKCFCHILNKTRPQADSDKQNLVRIILSLHYLVRLAFAFCKWTAEPKKTKMFLSYLLQQIINY